MLGIKETKIIKTVAKKKLLERQAQKNVMKDHTDNLKPDLLHFYKDRAGVGGFGYWHSHQKKRQTSDEYPPLPHKVPEAPTPLSVFFYHHGQILVNTQISGAERHMEKIKRETKSSMTSASCLQCWHAPGHHPVRERV